MCGGVRGSFTVRAQGVLGYINSSTVGPQGGAVPGPQLGEEGAGGPGKGSLLLRDRGRGGLEDFVVLQGGNGGLYSCGVEMFEGVPVGGG